MASIDGKSVGEGRPCYVCFEVGPTHSGFDSAKRLIRHAAKAGADAVKFQIFDPDELVADKKALFSYQVLVDRESGMMETVTEPLYDIFVRRALQDSEWRQLKEYADSLGVSFFATVGDECGLELVLSMGVHSIKIASADVNHLPFIRLVARSGLCVQLDTGSANLSEIEEAVDAIREEGNDNIVIHNCPSGYPARIESINLRMIPMLRNLFSCAVGFSDHSSGYEMDIAAVAVGADLVEKTITEDRTTRSVEHVMSIEPHEMKKFVQTINDVQVAMGESRRTLSTEEKEKRLVGRRSVHLAASVKAGQRLADIPVHFRRPGYGIPPDQYESLLEMKITSDLEAGHRLSLYDLAE